MPSYCKWGQLSSQQALIASARCVKSSSTGGGETGKLDRSHAWKSRSPVSSSSCRPSACCPFSIIPAALRHTPGDGWRTVAFLIDNTQKPRPDRREHLALSFRYIKVVAIDTAPVHYSHMLQYIRLAFLCLIYKK